MKKKDIKFICTKCGLCCNMVKTYKENIDKFPSWVQELVNEFPYDYDKRTGRCSQLADDNTCMVYENRPDLCNIDKIYDRYHWNWPSRIDWYKQNNRQCNKMILYHRLPKEFFVDISQYDRWLLEEIEKNEKQEPKDKQ